VAAPDQAYRVRVTALAPRVVEVLNGAFLSDHPLAGEPLVLEQTPFYPLAQETHWEGLTSYPSLLTYANPRRRIGLRFQSPTGFRRRDNVRVEPAPELCLTGYLRKWNAFSDILLPEGAVLDYVREDLRVVAQELRPVSFKLGQYAIPGLVGSVEWEATGEEPALLRLVNALVDYAAYCGTGIQTTQGMGQTVRTAAERTKGPTL
jgi:CRISPR/Cas system endoribonuclease Cas6 (RAMP superfamily)